MSLTGLTAAEINNLLNLFVLHHDKFSLRSDASNIN